MIFSLSCKFDPTGEAQRYYGQGNRARLLGNTGQAREYHDKAGRVLEADILNKRKRADKDAIRYLAATQYYLGGHYLKAQAVCRKIQADLFPQDLRESYLRFFKAVQERAKPEYAKTIRAQLHRHLQQREFQQGLDLLKEHQFVIEDEAVLAMIRGYCCERKGDYESAAIFNGDVVRRTVGDPEQILLSTAAPLWLSGHTKLNEAWTYAQFQLQFNAHALSYLTASVVRFKMAALASEPAEKNTLFKEQLQLFLEGERQFVQLAPAEQRHGECRELLIVSYAEAILASLNCGQDAEAKAILDRSLAFAPENAFLHTLAGDLKALLSQSGKGFQTILELENQFTQKHARRDPFPQLAA